MSQPKAPAHEATAQPVRIKRNGVFWLYSLTSDGDQWKKLPSYVSMSGLTHQDTFMHDIGTLRLLEGSFGQCLFRLAAFPSCYDGNWVRVECIDVSDEPPAAVAGVKSTPPTVESPKSTPCSPAPVIKFAQFGYKWSFNPGTGWRHLFFCPNIQDVTIARVLPALGGFLLVRAGSDRDGPRALYRLERLPATSPENWERVPDAVDVTKLVKSLIKQSEYRCDDLSFDGFLELVQRFESAGLVVTTPPPPPVHRFRTLHITVRDDGVYHFNELPSVTTAQELTSDNYERTSFRKTGLLAIKGCSNDWAHLEPDELALFDQLFSMACKDTTQGRVIHIEERPL